MNYMRILSKSSVISSSSVKSLTPSEEITNLHTEIDTLRQNIEALKLTIESRDAAFGTLAREKEKLYVELKSTQRTNRNLHQQLEDERDMHSKEKEFLIEEIKRLSKNYGRFHENTHEISTEYTLLKEELRAKDEVICNICSKYMKIKMSKTILLDELRKIQIRSQKACKDVITLLQENKQSLDDLLNQILEFSKVPPNSKHFFKMLKTNANLHYENTQLKVSLTSPISNPFDDHCYLFERKHQQEKFRKISRSKKEIGLNRNVRNFRSQHTVQRDKYVKQFYNSNENIFSFPCLGDTIYRSHSDSRLVNRRKQS